MPAHPLDLAGREAALFQGADEPVHVTGVFQLQGAVNAVKIRAEGGQFLPAHIHDMVDVSDNVLRPGDFMRPQKGGIEKGGTYERDCYIEKG